MIRWTISKSANVVSFYIWTPNERLEMWLDICKTKTERQRKLYLREDFGMKETIRVIEDGGDLIYVPLAI